MLVPNNAETTKDQPPSYDVAVEGSAPGARESVSVGPDVPGASTSGKQPGGPAPAEVDQAVGGSSQMKVPAAVPVLPQRMVYYYRHPQRGQISSFFPPDSARGLCLMHGHMPHTTHGILGVLAAVFFFPIGVALCMLDRRSTCARCGEVLEDGLF